MKKGFWLFLAIFLLFPFSGKAEDLSEKIVGRPIILENGDLLLNGKHLRLWGITRLDEDQQCWENQVTWDCGEQASFALRHDIEGRFISCEIKAEMQDNIDLAQCFAKKKKSNHDIARRLVAKGWAFDNPSESQGLYTPDQNEAQNHGRGIWNSKFQTPEDWKQGILRFYGDPSAFPPSQEEDENQEQERLLPPPSSSPPSGEETTP